MEHTADVAVSLDPRKSGAGASVGPGEGCMDDMAGFPASLMMQSDVLGGDLTDVGVVLEDMSKLTSDAGRGGGGRAGDGLLSFNWDQPDPSARSDSHAWHTDAHGSKTGADLMDSLAPDKAQTEPGDSSEWEQTREQIGNPLGMQHTDSPESLMMGAMSRPTLPSDQSQGLGVGGGLEDAHNFDLAPDFMYRGQLGMQAAPDAMPSSRPLMARYSEMQPGMDPEALDAISTPLGWDRRQAFVSAPLEADTRHMGRHGYWGSGGDMGGLARQGYGAMRRDAGVYHTRSDVSSMLPGAERALPPRRQFSAELPYGGMVDGGHAGHDGYMQSPMADSYGRKPWISPRVPTPGRSGYGPASGFVMEPPPTDTPRKRLRESYSMSEDRSMATPVERSPMLNSQGSGSSGRSRATAEERLINELKSKINGLDGVTKSALKESLYRISRNTNNRVTGMVEVTPSRMGGSRHSYVDRLVANLMYNRYEPQPQMAPPPQTPGQWPQSPGFGGGGGAAATLSRGTPRLGDDAKNLQPLRQESNPNA